MPNVATDANKNLTSAEKELLLWHWKMGIGMQRVQKLMQCVEVRELNGSVTIMDQVITPHIKSAATCLIPVCQCASYLVLVSAS